MKLPLTKAQQWGFWTHVVMICIACGIMFVNFPKMDLAMFWMQNFTTQRGYVVIGFFLWGVLSVNVALYENDVDYAVMNGIAFILLGMAIAFLFGGSTGQNLLGMPFAGIIPLGGALIVGTILGWQQQVKM